MKPLAVLLLAAAAFAQDPLPERYRTVGELRWASDAEGGAPFVFADPAAPTQEIGFEVDLAQELGRALGVRVRRVQTAWEHMVEALDHGDCDFAMNGFEPTPARLPQVRFTRPYYVFQQQLVAPVGSALSTLADCAGRRIGCLGQSASQGVLEALPGIQVQIYEDPVRAFDEVVNGRNAAALTDLPIAVAYRAKYPGLQAAGAPFGEFFYAIAVRKGEAPLQRALDGALVRLRDDGALERIYRKWGLWNDAQQRLREDRLARLLEGQSVPAATPAAGAGDAADPAAADAPAFAWGPAIGLLLLGALRTAGISVAAMALAIALGVALALGRLYGPRPLRWAVVAYVELFRGTPVLVQLLFLYYGLGQFPALQMSATTAGVLGLGLNYAAYEAEIWRASLLAIPRAQTEAALALGLSGPATLRHVLLPQALRLSLAPSTNDFVALFKDSSVVMVISVVELTKQYNMLASASGRHIALGALTCAIYLAMSVPLAIAARAAERALAGDRS